MGGTLAGIKMIEIARMGPGQLRAPPPCDLANDAMTPVRDDAGRGEAAG